MRLLTARMIRAWWPTATWVALVFLFSGDLFSAQNTGSVLDRLLRFLHPEITLAQIATLNFVVRKGAHVVNYAALCMLTYFSMKATLPEASHRVWVLLAVAVCALVAALDEWMQTGTAMRSGSAMDIALDTSAAAAAMLLLTLFLRRRRELA